MYIKAYVAMLPLPAEVVANTSRDMSSLMNASNSYDTTSVQRYSLADYLPAVLQPFGGAAC